MAAATCHLADQLQVATEGAGLAEAWDSVRVGIADLERVMAAQASET
ncbi:MAG: hypothetical protein KIT14_10310 [bacterium]|nr:hypothetical protein [bacterium]